MGDIVDFHKAKIGEEALVYSAVDGEDICGGEFSFVTGLEWFDDRDGEIKLKRQRWFLLAEDLVVLPDPHPLEDDE